MIRGHQLFWATLLFVALGTAGIGQAQSQSPSSSTGPYKAFGYPWENNNLGISDQVPEPWTDLQYATDKVGCWGRDYFLSNGIMPRQITSQGQELFAKPPTVDLAVEGKSALSPLKAAPTLTRKDKDRAEYKVPYSGDGYRMDAEASLEYDGFFRIDLNFVPQKPVSITQLTLNLPLQKSVGLFFSRYLEYDFDVQRFERGDFIDSMGRLDRPVQMRFNPSVWVGNHDVGIEWSCETDAGWSSDAPEKAIQILPGPDAVLMQIQVIGKPTRIDKPFTLSFALYPTPIKKLPNDWRNVSLIHSAAKPEAINASNHRIYGMAWGPWAYPMKYIGLPDLTPSDASGPGRPGPAARNLRRGMSAAEDDSETEGLSAAAKIANGRRRMEALGIHLVPYSSLYGLPAKLPHGEWKDYTSAWATMDPRGEVKNATWARLEGLPPDAPSRISVCLYPKSIRDFLVWEFVQAIEKNNIGGMYVDLAAPVHLCQNPNHPHGEVVRRGGEYYPFFWQRELMKRLYVACKSRKSDFLITLHHGKVPVVCSGFADVVLSGEALNVTFRSSNWSLRSANEDPTAYVPDYGKLPDDFFEIQYSQQMGFENMLLSQIVKFNDQLMKSRPELLKKYTRILLTRAAVYDIPLSSIRLDRDLYNAYLEAQGRFGWLTDVTYVAPWESAKFLSAGGSRLKTAFYLKPKENKLMLVLSNFTGGDIQDSVSLNVEALRSAGIKLSKNPQVLDATDNKPSSSEGGRIKVSIPSNDYRVLIVQ